MILYQTNPLYPLNTYFWNSVNVHDRKPQSVKCFKNIDNVETRQKYLRFSKKGIGTKK